MSYEQIVRSIEPFMEFQENGTAPYGNIAAHIGDCALNLRDLPRVIGYLKSRKIEGWLSVPGDGFRVRAKKEWLSYIEAMRVSGTEILEFTLYGKRDTHDWFSNCTGSYDAIHALAGMWHESGGSTSWGIFVHKNNLTELTDLRREITDRYHVEVPLQIWSYSGWGAKIESLRIDRHDLIDLDATSQDELSFYRSEKEWVAELQRIDESPFHRYPNVMHLVIGNTGEVRIPYTTAGIGHNGLSCGNLYTHGVDQIMQQREHLYLMWQSKYPPISEICRRYGSIGNEKLYDRGSILRKWSAAFDDERDAS